MVRERTGTPEVAPGFLPALFGINSHDAWSIMRWLRRHCTVYTVFFFALTDDVPTSRPLVENFESAGLARARELELPEHDHDTDAVWHSIVANDSTSATTLFVTLKNPLLDPGYGDVACPWYEPPVYGCW